MSFIQVGYQIVARKGSLQSRSLPSLCLSGGLISVSSMGGMSCLREYEQTLYTNEDAQGQCGLAREIAIEEYTRTLSHL